MLLVVDVVRTDSHLEFYEDTKNLARMSDILAVYAWVDPATGYCQGCSFSYGQSSFFAISIQSSEEIPLFSSVLLHDIFFF